MATNGRLHVKFPSDFHTVVHTCNLRSLEAGRQKDPKFEASFVYIMSLQGSQSGIVRVFVRKETKSGETVKGTCCSSTGHRVNSQAPTQQLRTL